MNGFVCIHAHFYQPPRENAWLEAVEVQDSAYPFHDWNERVTAECYASNATARILDENGRIRTIVNNYAKISFNFGPTLLSWLELNSPTVYQAILDADQESRQRFAGHVGDAGAGPAPVLPPAKAFGADGLAVPPCATPMPHRWDGGGAGVSFSCWILRTRDFGKLPVPSLFVYLTSSASSQAFLTNRTLPSVR